MAVNNVPVPSDRAATATEPVTPAGNKPRRVRSEDLLKGGVEILIEHHGREYRLRVTQNGKLILTA